MPKNVFLSVFLQYQCFLTFREIQFSPKNTAKLKCRENVLPRKFHAIKYLTFIVISTFVDSSKLLMQVFGKSNNNLLGKTVVDQMLLLLQNALPRPTNWGKNLLALLGVDGKQWIQKTLQILNPISLKYWKFQMHR